MEVEGKSLILLGLHQGKVKEARQKPREEHGEREIAYLTERKGRDTGEKWWIKRSCLSLSGSGELSADEFQDNVRLRYNFIPLNYLSGATDVAAK